MKKIWILLLSLILILSLSACTTGSGDVGEGQFGSNNPAVQEDDSDKDEDKEKEDKDEEKEDSSQKDDGEDNREENNNTDNNEEPEDNKPEDEKTEDNKEEVTYDFSNIGLSENTYNTLVAYSKIEPGVYDGGKNIICENGDYICKKESGSTWEFIYDVDTYQVYTLTYDYSGKDNLTSDYNLVNFGPEHKYEFYRELSGYSFSALFGWKKNDDSKVYADYQAYLADCGYTLLDGETVATATEENYGKFELLEYTEYSRDIDYSMFKTTYLHPSRGTEGMYDSVKDKILHWKIYRSNYYDFFKETWLYTEYKLTLTFDESFTEEDAAALVSVLESQYGCVADQGYPFTYNGYAYKGQIAVYDYPFSEGFDYMYDTYEISYIKPIEGLTLYPTLNATYLNYEWDDAGTSHYILRDGLHKYFPREENGWYDIILLSAAGASMEHPAPPVKQEYYFSAKMQYSYSSDEPGAWHDTYQYERVGDTFVSIRESEYSFDYEVIKKIGDRYYKRTGYCYKPDEYETNPQTEWYDFEETYEMLDYTLIDEFSRYYREYPKPEAGATVTVAGKNCQQYTYQYDDRTYTYAVYDNSLTLKYVQKDEWGESITEFLNYDEISAFSAEAQSLIDASGIASYVPPAE